MVTFAQGASDAQPSRPAPGVGHGHAGDRGHSHPDEARRATASRLSLLRMGLAPRLAVAGGAAVILWSAIALGLS